MLDAGKLMTDICPDCGRTLRTLYHAKNGREVKWTKPVDERKLDMDHAEEMGGTGCYRMPNIAYDGLRIPDGLEKPGMTGVDLDKSADIGLRVGRLLLTGREVVDMVTGEVLTRKTKGQIENDNFMAYVLTHPEIYEN